MSGSADGGGGSGGDDCQMAFSADNMSFYSSCACKDVTTMTNGACSLSGFSFQKEKDGPTPFAPRFPASSPWVTSISSTQVQYNTMLLSCLVLFNSVFRPFVGYRSVSVYTGSSRVASVCPYFSPKGPKGVHAPEQGRHWTIDRHTRSDMFCLHSQY